MGNEWQLKWNELKLNERLNWNCCGVRSVLKFRFDEEPLNSLERIGLVEIGTLCRKGKKLESFSSSVSCLIDR